MINSPSVEAPLEASLSVHLSIQRICFLGENDNLESQVLLAKSSQKHDTDSRTQ